MHKLEAWAGFPFVPIFIAFYTDKNLVLWEKPQFICFIVQQKGVWVKHFF